MNRRGFLGGLLTLAAPAIIHTPGLLMPIKPEKFVDPHAFDIDVRDGVIYGELATTQTISEVEAINRAFYRLPIVVVSEIDNQSVVRMIEKLKVHG